MQKLLGKRKNRDCPRHPAINSEYVPDAGHGHVFPAVSQASQPAVQGNQAPVQASQVRPGEPFRFQGDELARKRDYNGALVMYNTALRSAPNDLSLLLSRSMAHSMSEPPNLDFALKDADYVIQLNPNWWQGWLQRGQVLLRNGDLQSAKEALANATAFAQGFDIITAQRALDDVRACHAPPSSHPQLIGQLVASASKANQPIRLNLVHRPLIGDDIRLLILRPGSFDDPIHCQLKQVSLSAEHAYDALSYVWGNASDTSPISLNGTPHHITKNLEIALRYLRHRESPKVLWVDAICINQSDINERNHQVQQMADIYSQAQRVIGWLGLETEASQAAFKFLATSYLRSRFNRRELMDDPGWNALKDVYQRDYWKRVWIIQEICLARQVLIVCGNTQIPWNYISELCNTRKHYWLQYLSKGEREFMRSLVARIDHARATHQKKGCILWTLLESFKESQCLMVHDKIYGLLGLSSDCTNEDLPIDYSKSVSQLYRDVVWFHYRKFQQDLSSPHSAQLMKFSEFLRSFLECHPQYSDDLEHEEAEMEPLHASGQEITAHCNPSTVMQISASGMMFIDSFLSSEDASKFAASELVDFLEEKIPYSHLGFWRDFVSPSLSEVYTVKKSRAFATGHVAMPQKAEQQEGIRRPSAFIASKRCDSGSSDKLSILGIAPPTSKPGDMLCTFVDSHIALLMRPVPRDETPIIPANQDDREIVGHTYILIGRAYLDFRYMERMQLFESRLTSDKTIELVISTAPSFSPQGTPWPATLSIDMRTLQIVAKAIAKPRAKRFNDRQLELLPSIPVDIETSCSHPFQRSIDSSELSTLQNDPWFMQYIHGPGYIGIRNLGATGYVSCVLQIMYILKPFRTKILQTEFEHSLASALQEVFQKLRTSLLPVSPENLVKSFGWGPHQIFELQDVFEFWEVLLSHIAAIPALKSLDGLFSGSFLMKSRESQREVQFLDYPFDAKHERLLDSLKINREKSKITEFRHLPPVLILEGKFWKHDITTDTMKTIRSNFEYPSSFLFSEVANLSEAAGVDVAYQLHGVVVHEDVKPTARYMVYLRPREDDQWVLFFNETVTFASHREVFEDTFKRATGPLRTPRILVYLKVSMLDTLLG